MMHFLRSVSRGLRLRSSVSIPSIVVTVVNIWHLTASIWMILIYITPFQQMKSSFRSTIDDIKSQVRESGGSLTKLPNEYRTRLLYDWLKRNLPKHLGVWVIDAPGRSNEVNVYTIGSPDGKGNSDRSRVRNSKAARMPERVKKWKRDRFGVREKI